MHKFTDASGTDWRLEFTIGLIKTIRDQTKADGQVLDLLQPHEGRPPLIQILHEDLYLFVRVLFLAVVDQAEEAGVDFGAFCKLLSGEASYAAYGAFMEEWADFFRGLHRPHLATVIEAHREMVAQGTEVARKKYEAAAIKASHDLKDLEAMSLDQMLAKFPDAGSGATSGSWPASAGSIPDP